MADGLLDPRTIRQLAAELDLRPTKQRGQNFVHDANTVRRIVRAGEVTSTDHVVEIGPGLGSLTLALLQEADRVTAVEVDPVLAGALPDTVAAQQPGAQDRLDVVHADALTVTDLPDPQPTASSTSRTASWASRSWITRARSWSRAQPMCAANASRCSARPASSLTQ